MNTNNQLNQAVQQISSAGAEDQTINDSLLCQSSLPINSLDSQKIEVTLSNNEESSYMSPKHTIQIQRLRADSNGHFHRIIPSQVALHSGGGVDQSQQHHQMIFGEQPPFYQYLGAANQPSPYYQPHASVMADVGTTQSVVSMSHPSSSIQLLNSNLLNMEPFSTQHISQSGHSNFPSRKGSIRSDDSLSGSPRLTISHCAVTNNPNNNQNVPPIQRIPHLPPGAFRKHYESTLSVFSRQSTAQFKSTNLGGGRHTATASVACNEGGPIGLREYSNAHMSTYGVREGHIGGPAGGHSSSNTNGRAPAEDDELEFKDEVLDKIILPSIQINIQQLQITLVNSLRNVEEEVMASASPKETDIPNSASISKPSGNSIFERGSPPGSSPQSNTDQTINNTRRNSIIPQQSAFQEEASQASIAPQATTGSNNSSILNQSISSANLIVGAGSQFNNPQSAIVQPQISSSVQTIGGCSLNTNQQTTEQYQPLSIEQSIWSTQIPPQTQQEFLQYTQLQQQTQSAAVDLQPASNQSSSSQANLSANAQPYIPVGQQQQQQQVTQPSTQQPQPQYDQPQAQPLYQQAFEIIGQHQHAQQVQASTINQPPPQVLHQQFPNQYSQDIQMQASHQMHQNPNQTQQEAQYQAMLEQQQKIALNQIISQTINHGVSQPWQMAAAMNHPHHLIGSPQIQGPTSQGLSQQDIREVAAAAAQIEAIQQLMAATGVNPVMQNYLYEQSQQQQQQQKQLQTNQANSQNQSIFQSDQHQLAPGVVVNSQQDLECFNDPMSLHQQDFDTQLQQLYMNRQFNRYMRNPINKSKSGSLIHQSSFRVCNSQSPDLIFPGNVSVLRPPPGFEHIIPKNHPYAAQMMLEQHIQMQQTATLQGIAYQQHQQASQVVQQQIQQQLLQQQQHQNELLLLPLFLRQSSGWGQYMNSSFPGSNFPQNQVYSSFYEAQMQYKQTELDQQLRQTTQSLDNKLMENLELQEHFSDQEQQNLTIIVEEDQSLNTPYIQKNINDVANPCQQQLHNASQLINSTQQHQQQQPSQQANLYPGKNGHFELSAPHMSGHQQTVSSSTNSSEEDNILHPQIAHQQNLPPRHSEIHANGTSEQHIQYHSQEEQKVGESLMHSSESVDQIDNNTGASPLYLKKDPCIHSFKESKESKERIEVFKKLRTQLSKLKNELVNQTDQSAKLTPFKYDPGKYLEKMLNLLKIINEVDANNNIAELRNEHEKTKRQLEKANGEIQKLKNEATQGQLDLQNVTNDNKKLQNEIKLAREQHEQEREQLELLIKFTKDQLQKDKEVKESLQAQIDALVLQLTTEQQKTLELQSQLSAALLQVQQESTFAAGDNATCGAKCIKERENFKLIKKDYGKKAAEQQIEINELREFIKNKSQKEYQKRQQDRKQFEEEFKSIKEQYELAKKQSEKMLKERDNEIRILQESLMQSDPEMYQKLQTQDKLMCPDCKKKEAKINDSEERIKQLNEYIKNKKEIIGKKYEEDIAKLKEQNQQLQEEILKLSAAQSQIKQQNISMQASEYAIKLGRVLERFSKVTNFSFEPEVSSLISSIISSSPQEQEKNLDNSQNINILIQQLLTTQIIEQPSRQEMERGLLQKMIQSYDLSEAEKEQIKEGRKQRKLCHQVIIEVERLIYMMNSLLVTEQTNLEDQQEHTATSQQNATTLASRIASNRAQFDLFKRLMESYLQLPHTLKPIFVAQKRYESIILGLYRADPQVLYQLSAEGIERERQRAEEMGRELTEMAMERERMREEARRLEGDVERQRQKIIELKEQIVQIKSAYNALEKHLYSMNGGGKGSNGASTPLGQVSRYQYNSQKSLPPLDVVMRMSQTSLQSNSSSSSDQQVISQQEVNNMIQQIQRDLKKSE